LMLSSGCTSCRSFIPPVGGGCRGFRRCSHLMSGGRSHSHSGVSPPPSERLVRQLEKLRIDQLSGLQLVSFGAEAAYDQIGLCVPIWRPPR
jgi:hypothetical protein